MTNFKNLRAWCLTDGSAGMISQVKGLADALNLNFEQKTIDLKFPWNKLPAGILPPSKIIFNKINVDFLLSESLGSQYKQSFLMSK